MDTLLRVGLSNAVAATALALAATLVGRFCRRPALAHGLWLLVLLKLITPPLWNVPIPWPMDDLPVVAGVPVEEPADDVSASLAVSEDDLEWLNVLAAAGAEPTIELAAVIGPDLSFPPPENLTTTSPAGTGPAASPAASGNPAEEVSLWSLVDWKQVLLLLWVTGSLVWFCLAFFRIGGFLRLLRFARPAPAWLQEETRTLAERMQLSRAPGVWMIDGRLSPMLWAFGRPRLLLPVKLLGQISDEQRATLLAHELAHLVRGDHWVRLLQLLVTGLYWWHPAVWWARREMQEAEEQCCDAWVLWTLPDSARTYATALMETVDFLSEARPVLPPVASGIGHVHDLRRRLTMILRGTTPRALTWSGYLAVLSLGALLLPLVPSLADEPVYLRVRLEDEKERKDKPRVIRVEDVKEVKKDKPAYVRVEDDKKSEDEVSRTEAEVKKAQAQMQEAMERLRAAQRRLAELHSKREPGKAANVLGEKMQGMTIIIQDASGKEIQKIKVPSGADLEPKIRGALELHLPKALELRKDNILRKGGPDEAGKKADMEKKEGERREVIIRRGEAGAPPPERMADLEKRLDMLMRELEALRREIRRGGPGEGPRGGGGSGGSIRPPEAPRAPLPPAPRRPGEGAAPALPGLPGSPGRPPERRKGEDEKGRVEKPDAAASFFFGLYRQ